MSEPIKAGDLVVVVKTTPCCGNPKALGMHFVVKSLRPARGRYHCSHCNTTWPTEVVALKEVPFAYQLHRLKRIPPLAELEGQRTQEDIREPA